MKRTRILVIGLDGATFDLIRPWAQSGALPTFRRLLEEGAGGELRSTLPPMTAPAWTSFLTGKNPGKHGLYDWIARRPDSYSVSPVTFRHCREPHLSQLLSEAGLRVCLLNIPMTFPPYPVNGVMISGMPAPSKTAGITYPDTLLAKIEDAAGEYLLYPDPGQAYSDQGIDAFLDLLYRTTERRFEVLDFLRAREDWDFCMAVINGTDTVQHAMWKFMDPTHPLHAPQKAAKYGDAILRYFQYVDGKLGEVISALDEDTVLMLMSDHGFGPIHKFIHVNNWLKQNGWLKIKRTPVAQIKEMSFQLGFSPMRVYNFLMRFGLGKLKREVVRGHGQGLLKTLFLSFDEVDWPRTTAYSLGNVGQIYINLRGREPQGMVEPGDEYEAIRSTIIARLGELTDPQTGEKVVQAIYRREELYTGDEAGRAADIVFLPTRLEYFGFGEYEFGSHQVIESLERGISGTHRMNGLFLMWGRPIKDGQWLEGAGICDLAPTILQLLGQPIPADMDGRVLVGGLRADLVDVMPRFAVPSDGEMAAQEDGDGLTADEEARIAQRLRDLGYVG